MQKYEFLQQVVRMKNNFSPSFFHVAGHRLMSKNFLCWDEVAPRPSYPGRLNLPSYSNVHFFSFLGAIQFEMHQKKLHLFFNMKFHVYLLRKKKHLLTKILLSVLYHFISIKK